MAKHDMSRSREVLLVVLMFAFGFLTLYYLSGFIYDFQGADAAIYGNVARNIVEKNSMESNFIWASWTTWGRLGTLPQVYLWKAHPAYIYVIAGFFWFFGSSFWTMKLVNVTFGALLVVPVFYLTKSLFDKEKAIVASILSFSYPLLIIGSIVPGDKIFDAFVIVSAIASFTQGARIRNALVSGILCGLAFLSRFDFGGALFVSALIYYLLGARLESAPFKRRVATTSVFTIAFALVILPWLLRNYMVFGYALSITGIAARVFFSSKSPVLVSPQTILLDLGAFYFVGMLLSSLLQVVRARARLIRRRLPRFTKFQVVLNMAIVGVLLVFLLVVAGLDMYALSFVSIYPQLIYQSSPLIFVFAVVGATASIKKIGILHPMYTFLFLSVALYTSLQDVSLSSTYMIPYIPLVIVFAVSAVFDVSSVMFGSIGNDFSGGSKWVSKLKVIWTPKHLMLLFLLGSIFLSLVPQYAIFTQAEKVQQGPFLSNNWGKAYDWILVNTDPQDTIMARFPPITFYTQRRTISLEPLNVAQFFTLVGSGNVSYLVVDNDAFIEARSVPNNLIAWLADYPQRFEGVNLVYEVGNPRLQIFDVRAASQPSALIGWIDDSFSANWTADPGLTFESDGRYVEMTYDNTMGSETAFMWASKTLPSAIRFSDYPFIVIGYKFQYWTKASIVYFRAIITNSTGGEHYSEATPFPANESDFGWHTFAWNPTKSEDVSKLSLMIRVGAGSEFSMVIDYVVLSKWPINPYAMG